MIRYAVVGAGWISQEAFMPGVAQSGNSTIAAALTSALFGGTPSDWVGPGTGSDAEGLARKINAIERGLALHGGQPALEVLSKPRTGGCLLGADRWSARPPPRPTVVAYLNGPASARALPFAALQVAASFVIMS